MDRFAFPVMRGGPARGRGRGSMPRPFSAPCGDRQGPNPGCLQGGYGQRPDHGGRFDSQSMYHMQPTGPIGRSRGRGTRIARETHCDPSSRQYGEYCSSNVAGPQPETYPHSRHTEQLPGQFDTCNNHLESAGTNQCFDQNYAPDSSFHSYEFQSSRSFDQGPTAPVQRPPPGFGNRPPYYPPPDNTVTLASSVNLSKVTSDNETNRNGQSLAAKSELSPLAEVFVPHGMRMRSPYGTAMRPLSPPPGLSTSNLGPVSPPPGLSLSNLGPVSGWNLASGMSAGFPVMNSAIKTEDPQSISHSKSPPGLTDTVVTESKPQKLPEYISLSTDQSQDSAEKQIPDTEDNGQSQRSPAAVSKPGPTETDKQPSPQICTEERTEERINRFNPINPDNPYLTGKAAYASEAANSNKTEQENSQSSNTSQDDSAKEDTDEVQSPSPHNDHTHEVDFTSRGRGRGGFPVTGQGQFVQPQGYPYLPRDDSRERGRRSSWDGDQQSQRDRRRNRSWDSSSDVRNTGSSPRTSRSSSQDSMDRHRSRERSASGSSRSSSFERPAYNSSPQYNAAGTPNKLFLSPNVNHPLRSPARSPKYYRGQYFGSGSSDNWSPGGSPSKRKQEPPDVVLSKSLSMLLRHSARSQGFQLMKGGFLYVSDILERYDKVNGFTEQDIINIVECNDKKRFALERDAETGRLKIRANQGHTMQVDDLDLKPILSSHEVDKVIHGTFLSCWNSIKLTGLNRMRRNHIHFAVGEPGKHEVISGMRKECEVMIFIDMEKALNDGLKFYRSANNVILSPGNENGVILPVYFQQAIQRIPWMMLEFDQDASVGMTRQDVQDAIRRSKAQKNKLREDTDLVNRDANRSPTKHAAKKLKRSQAQAGGTEIDLASCRNIFEVSASGPRDTSTSPDFQPESPDDWDDAIFVTDVEQSKCAVDHILTTPCKVDDIVFCCYGENLGSPGGTLRTVVVVIPNFVYVYQLTCDKDFLHKGHLRKLICHAGSNKVFNNIRGVSSSLIEQHNILLQGCIWDIELMYEKVRQSLSRVNIDKLADLDFCPKQWRLCDEDRTSADPVDISSLVTRGKLMFIAFKMFIRCQTEIKKLKRDIYAAAIPSSDEHFLAKKIQELKLENKKERLDSAEKQKQDKNHNNRDSSVQLVANTRTSKHKPGKNKKR